MNADKKFPRLVGAMLTVAGSFLPWERAGGFLDVVTNGIRIDFASFQYWGTGIHQFPVYDYGGALVVFLTLAIILLPLQPFGLIKNSALWNLVISTVLMVSSLFFVSRWLFHRFEHFSSSEPPTLRIGLICVVFGSALLLWSAFITHHSATSSRSSTASQR